MGHAGWRWRAGEEGWREGGLERRDVGGLEGMDIGAGWGGLERRDVGSLEE